MRKEKSTSRSRSWKSRISGGKWRLAWFSGAMQFSRMSGLSTGEHKCCEILTSFRKTLPRSPLATWKSS